MAISSSNQGYRPGVCTSTTRPSAPYEGQMIYETDTNRVLVWDNAAWVMIADTDTPPGLQLIKSETSVTATNASPKGVESVFTSDFRNYRIVWEATQASANGVLQIQLYTGTNTPATTGIYGYGWGGSWVSSTPSYNYGAYSTTNPFSPDTILWVGATIGTSYSAHGWLDIFSPQISGTSTRFTGQAFSAYTGTWYNTALVGSGGVETTSQYTGFRWIPSAGTTTITYRVYGYRD